MSEEFYPSDYIAPAKYAIREVTVMARKLEREGRRVLYLNIGDPNVYDFDLVNEAKEAAIWALNHRKSGYAPSEGLPEALRAIEADAANRQHIKNIVGIVFRGQSFSHRTQHSTDIRASFRSFWCRRERGSEGA